MIAKLSQSFRRGASGMQYTLVIAGVALVSIGAFTLTGGSLQSILTTVDQTFNGTAPLRNSTSPAPTQPTASPQLTWTAGGTFQLAAPATTGTAVVYTLANNGTADTIDLTGTIAVQGTDAARFTVSANTCNRVLAAGASCTLSVTPNATAPGSYAATLVSSAHNQPAVALSLQPTGYSPLLAWSGNGSAMNIAAPANDGAVVSFALVNNGNAISANPTGTIALGGSAPTHFTITQNDCTAPLAPAAFCLVQVKPVATDNASFSATLSTSIENAPSIALAGNASGFIGLLTFDSDPLESLSIDDGNPTGACTDFNVTNSGDSMVTNLSFGAFGGANPANFENCTPSDTPCGSSLEADESCLLGFRLKATANGTYNGLLNLTGTGVTGQVAVTGQAAGFIGTISLGGSALSVAPITTGITQGSCTALPVTNTGTGVLAGLAIGSFTGTNPANFQACTAGTSPCGPTLALNATCNLGVRLTATTGGSYQAVANVTATDTAPATQTVTSTAGGYTGTLTLAANPLTIGAITSGGTIGACTAMNVANTGLGQITSMALSFSGTNPGNFQACSGVSNPCGTTLAPSANCNYGIQLISNSTGTYQASAVVTAGSVTGQRALTGTAGGYFGVIDPGSGTLAATAITNGVTPGACTAMPVTNSGTATLTNLMIEGFTGTNPGSFQTCAFSTSSCGASLAVGASCNLGFRLTTATAGSFSASATLGADNVSDVQKAVSGASNGYNCAAQSVSGYSVNALSHGATASVTRAQSITNGTLNYSATASCSNGTTSISGETSSTACNSGYTASGQSCVGSCSTTPLYYTGSTTFTPNANYAACTNFRAYVWGAGGGGGAPYGSYRGGGAGAFVYGRYAYANQALTIYVGTGGGRATSSAAGAGGTGAQNGGTGARYSSSTSYGKGGGGGGSSAVYIAGVPYLIAGGGGGGTGSRTGSGYTPYPSAANAASGGQAASGGSASAGVAGTSGGTASYTGGGGGGGGYAGGARGVVTPYTAIGGGRGGGSYVRSGATDSTWQSGGNGTNTGTGPNPGGTAQSYYNAAYGGGGAFSSTNGIAGEGGYVVIVFGQ